MKRFNRLTGTFDVSFVDINKPLGIYGDPNHIFVAESGGNFIIAINKESLAFSRISISNKLTYLCITNGGIFGGRVATLYWGVGQNLQSYIRHKMRI